MMGSLSCLKQKTILNYFFQKMLRGNTGLIKIITCNSNEVAET
jgi:hypothetical protein